MYDFNERIINQKINYDEVFTESEKQEYLRQRRQD